MERDGNISKRMGEAQQEDGESSVKRLKSSIKVEAFGCHVCAKPLGPPIFECPENHFFCSSCRDKLPKDKCRSCSGTLERSLGMERAVLAIIIDCRHTEHGCTEKISYYGKDDHEKACSHAPCLCPELRCGFTGTAAAELLDHLTGQHKWPSTTFEYWVPFDLPVVVPGARVLHCKNDGQLFLLSVRPAAQPPGLACSLVGVQPYLNTTRFGCTVSFLSFKRHLCTSMMDDLRPLRLSDWPPTECICVLPKAPNGAAEVVLRTTIVCADPDSEDDNISYIGSDADDVSSDEDDEDDDGSDEDDDSSDEDGEDDDNSDEDDDSSDEDDDNVANIIILN